MLVNNKKYEANHFLKMFPDNALHTAKINTVKDLALIF